MTSVNKSLEILVGHLNFSLDTFQHILLIIILSCKVGTDVELPRVMEFFFLHRCTGIFTEVKDTEDTAEQILTSSGFI